MSSEFLSPLLPHQRVYGHLKARKQLRALPLLELLQGVYKTDAHFPQYAVNPEVGAYRYTMGLLGDKVVTMIAIALDVDCPTKKSSEPGAIDLWYEGEEPKVNALLDTHGGYFFRTKGGYRIVWLIVPRVLTCALDGKQWEADYLSWLAYLERTFGIKGDDACKDWTRLQRVPTGMRDGEKEPVLREVRGELTTFDFVCIADEDRAKAPVKAPKTKGQAKADVGGKVIVGDGAWFKWLDARGMVKRSMGPGKWAIRCPNEGEHSSESETGTVLYAPEAGHIYGYIHCSHSHCIDRDFRPFAPDLLSFVDGVSVEDAPSESEDEPFGAIVVDDRNRTKACLSSASVLLHERFGDSIVYDTFYQSVFLAGVKLDEPMVLAVMCDLQQKHSPSFTYDHVDRAFFHVGQRRKVDALEAHLRSVKWDGVPRIGTFATQHLGAEDTPYHHEVIRIFLLSLAARGTKPMGCQADNMPVFQGDQGLGKTQMLRALGGPFYAELDATIGSKDALEVIQGKWLVEIGEMGAMSRAEVADTKSFVSRQTDRFRPAYGRKVIEVPRRCGFAGTSNPARIYKDDTGNRRFWALEVGKLDLARIIADRDQLFAEAVHRVDSGEPWHCTDPVLLKEAERQQAMRHEGDDWERLIDIYARAREHVTVEELYKEVLSLDVAKWGKGEQMRVAGCLTRLGYVRKRESVQGDRLRCWVRKDGSRATIYAVPSSPR